MGIFQRTKSYFLLCAWPLRRERERERGRERQRDRVSLCLSLCLSNNFSAAGSIDILLFSSLLFYILSFVFCFFLFVCFSCGRIAAGADALILSVHPIFISQTLRSCPQQTSSRQGRIRLVSHTRALYLSASFVVRAWCEAWHAQARDDAANDPLTAAAARRRDGQGAENCSGAAGSRRLGLVSEG